ncbi:hypothetical protein R70006_05814 [Paraburkholderia domus]|nr:hypothetical protein R70006_05814 [Paraburkholderia domus]CAE6889374.1 hypothetical protein R75471_02285 [Paraburkholderia domus]
MAVREKALYELTPQSLTTRQALSFNAGTPEKPHPVQHELEMVTLDELVPNDRLLRKIDAAVDFEFICEKVAHLHCAEYECPVLDPVVMFRPFRGAQRAPAHA